MARRPVITGPPPERRAKGGESPLIPYPGYRGPMSQRRVKRKTIMEFDKLLEAAIYALLNTPCEDDPEGGVSNSTRTYAIAKKLEDYTDAKITVSFEHV